MTRIDIPQVADEDLPKELRGQAATVKRPRVAEVPLIPGRTCRPGHSSLR